MKKIGKKEAIEKAEKEFKEIFDYVDNLRYSIKDIVDDKTSINWHIHIHKIGDNTIYKSNIIHTKYLFNIYDNVFTFLVPKKEE